MQKKILLISEALDAPFDEGIKNIVYSTFKQFEDKDNVFLVTKQGNITDNLKVIKIRMNKLFYNSDLKSFLKTYKPDIGIYIPIASCSFYSFIRAKMLKVIFNKMKVVILCVQHRKYSLMQKFIMEMFLKPDFILLLSKSEEPFYLNLGIKVKVLPPAVDTLKFCPPLKDEKNKIRAEFGIALDKKIILHVGHIKESRNLECFLDIQNQDNIQVIIVSSSTWGEDYELKKKLISAGVRIIDDFIPDMSKIYKMSDAYVFPVINKTGATEIPLSILEAMACNLTVITSRYGGLVDFFVEDNGFKYFDTREELLEVIKDLDESNISNHKKVESFTWRTFADEILSICEML
jgi:glycosyltransferase involved in cell wall biosynthesis